MQNETAPESDDVRIAGNWDGPGDVKSIKAGGALYFDGILDLTAAQKYLMSSLKGLQLSSHSHLDY